MSTEITSVSDQLKELKGHLPSVLAEIESVKDKPRIVILLSSAFIEDMIDTLCESYLNYHDEFKRLSSAQKLYILVETNHVSAERATHLDWIRGKRNKIAHSALFVLDKSHMPAWADKHHKTPDKTFSLCVQIMMALWNEHVEVLRPAYLKI